VVREVLVEEEELVSLIGTGVTRSRFIYI
jgi:hypothetical protein